MIAAMLLALAVIGFDQTPARPSEGLGRSNAAPVAMPAQGGGGKHVLIVTGLSGEPGYATSLGAMGGTLFDAARDRWGVDDSSLIYLAEDPNADRDRVSGKSTREAVLAALDRLAARVAPDDVVMIFLAGHGSQGDRPRLNLPGPDLTAADLAKAIAKLDRQLVVVVNVASASGGFIEAVGGPRRIVITATKTGFEKNATKFGDHFVKGLTSDEADRDKDGRLSLAEAYRFARDEVARAYQNAKRLLTEHAQIDDDGDGVGSAEVGEQEGLARLVTFTLHVDPAERDPRVASLVKERRRLEAQVASLKSRKATMDSTAYQRELEKLLVKLAETNEAIRAILEKK